MCEGSSKFDADRLARVGTTPAMAGPRERPRVLVVEDQFLVAREVARMLEELGCEVAGPARTLAEAQQFISREGLAGAVLDYRLDHTNTAGVAREIINGARPLLFITADSDSLPGDLETTDRLEKPFSADELATAVERLVARIHQGNKEAESCRPSNQS